MKKSEKRQQEVLAYLREQINENGFAPTIREICEALNIKSTSTAHSDINALIQQGYIKKNPSKPRTLVLVDNPQSEVINEDIKIADHDHTTSVSTSAMTSIDSSDLSKAMTFGGASSLDDTEIVMIPVIGNIAAGEPILAEQNINDTIAFPARFTGKGNNFCLKVRGDSMINAGINSGDYVIITECDRVKNGEIVAAVIAGEYEDGATVKRYYKENGHIRLQPENDEMEPIIVEDARIIGKVTAVLRYLG